MLDGKIFNKQHIVPHLKTREKKKLYEKKGTYSIFFFTASAFHHENKTWWYLCTTCLKHYINELKETQNISTSVYHHCMCTFHIAPPPLCCPGFAPYNTKVTLTIIILVIIHNKLL